jgi:hypothetical protein
MNKYISSMLLLLLCACSSNPHVKYVENNHKNQWLEKKHVYRSLASIHQEKEEKKVNRR